MQISLVETNRAVKDNPGFHIFGKVRRGIFLEEFQMYVDQILASEEDFSQGIYEIKE